MGRPKIEAETVQVYTTIGATMIAAIDKYAAKIGVSRNTAIRMLLGRALDAATSEET